MTTAIQPRNGADLDLGAIPAVQITTLDDLGRLTKMLVAAGYFPGVTSPQQAAAKIMYGAELGLPPVASLLGVNFFDNRLSLSAATIAGLIKRSGRYNYRPREWTATVCIIDFVERVDGKWEPCGTATFTMEQAARIVRKGTSLVAGDNWKNYPAAMLWARAISQGARAFCPDVFGGAVYSREELGDGGGDSPPNRAEGVDPQTGEIRAVEAEWSEVPAPPPPPSNGHAEPPPDDPAFAALSQPHLAPAGPAEEPFILAGPTPSAPLPLDTSPTYAFTNHDALLERIGVLVEELGWPPKQAGAWLKAHHKAASRRQLSREQAQAVVVALEAIKRGQPVAAATEEEI